VATRGPRRIRIPNKVLTLQDLFVREIDQYASFRGPGKLEGSIVNWLNGPLFRQVARERQTAARPLAARGEHELAAA